jgi:hypothetical protein
MSPEPTFTHFLLHPDRPDRPRAGMLATRPGGGRNPGNLLGRITDSTKLVVPGASVQITNVATTVTVQTVCNSNGINEGFHIEWRRLADTRTGSATLKTTGNVCRFMFSKDFGIGVAPVVGVQPGVVVPPSGFEPPTFCSGAIGTPSNPSCRYLGFQHLEASAFARPTS